MTTYCYHIPPIDFWTGAMTASQVLATENGHDKQADALADVASELANLEEWARTCFKRIGWEGDVREGPWFFAVPGENRMEFGYALKQDNNGSTFVASPVPLDWLLESTCGDCISVDDDGNLTELERRD